MLKHRFFPYIITACVLVILAVSLIGARVYIRQMEVKAATEALARILESETPHEHTHNHTNHNHTNAHGEYDLTLIEKTILESETPHEHTLFYVPREYDQNRWYTQVMQGNQGNQSEFQLEFEEWLDTGKLTPLVEDYFKMFEIWRQQIDNAIVTDVIQRIVTPDGTLHQVVVPKHQQYEEGDAILKSEIVDEEYLRKHYRSEGETDQEIPPQKGPTVVVNNVTYPMPDEYYEIEDPYEQTEYINKFVAALELGISMDEVEQKVASGEIIVSFSESEKRMVDEREAQNERGLLSYQISRSVLPKKPPLSDKPPVKVSFLPDEGEGAKRGWVRKAQRKQDKLGDVAQPQISEYESRIDDTRRPNHRSVSPELPSEQPGGQRITPSKPAMEDFLTSSPESLETLIEAQISPEERMKALFGEKLSPERKEKSPPFLTQDGPEEELRRLREAGSEGAKQREQHGHRADAPPPSR